MFSSIILNLKSIIDNKLIEKVRVEVASKMILAVLAFLLTGCTAIFFSMFSTHEPVFLHKTWKTMDGKTILYGNSLEMMELNGMPEGAMVIVFHNWNYERNIYKGVVYCQDHGGIVGKAELKLEPRNQIHLICTSEIDSNYTIDLLFRTNWMQ